MSNNDWTEAVAAFECETIRMAQDAWQGLRPDQKAGLDCRSFILGFAISINMIIMTPKIILSIAE
jgi:hypothetical protein